MSFSTFFPRARGFSRIKKKAVWCLEVKNDGLRPDNRAMHVCVPAKAGPFLCHLKGCVSQLGSHSPDPDGMQGYVGSEAGQPALHAGYIIGWMLVSLTGWHLNDMVRYKPGTAGHTP